MPYTLENFISVPLPRGMPEDDLSTGTVAPTIVESVGGTFDYYGSRTRHPRRHEFWHVGLYERRAEGILTRVTSEGTTRVVSDGRTRIIELSTENDLQERTDALKALRGAVGPLWRRRLGDGQMSWKRCRLLEVRHIEKIDNANAVSQVTSVFETADLGWASADAVTVTASAAAATPTALAIQNNGILPIDDAVLSITRTSGTITQVTVTGNGINITWTGSLGAGQTLTFDSGLAAVRIGTADAYGGFTLNAGHTADAWLPLPQGPSIMTVTVTGGAADLSLSYYPRWP